MIPLLAFYKIKPINFGGAKSEFTGFKARLLGILFISP